jgi:hypothetical protein
MPSYFASSLLCLSLSPHIPNRCSSFFEQKALIGAHSLYIIGIPTHREILEHQRQSSERGEQVFDAKKK